MRAEVFVCLAHGSIYRAWNRTWPTGELNKYLFNEWVSVSSSVKWKYLPKSWGYYDNQMS